VLLHGRLREPLAELLDVGRDEDRIHADQVLDAVLIEPIAEEPDGSRIRGSGVLVPDVGGEEFEEAPRRAIAGVTDDRRYARDVVGREPLRLRDDGEFPRLRHDDFWLLWTFQFPTPLLAQPRALCAS